MFLDIAQLIALIGFLWTFGKLQYEQNHKFDNRLDELSTKVSVLLEAEKFRSEFLIDQFERFDEKFNYLKASIASECLTNKD